MEEQRRETTDEERLSSSPVDSSPLMTVEADLSKGKIDEEDMVIDGRVLRGVDRILDLVDVVDDQPIVESHGGQDIIVIDGRVYERVTRPRNVMLDTAALTEHSAPPRIDNGLHDEIMKAVIKIAEGIVRDAVPDITERIIREEIEKLKADNQLS